MPPPSSTLPGGERGLFISPCGDYGEVTVFALRSVVRVDVSVSSWCHPLSGMRFARAVGSELFWTPFLRASLALLCVGSLDSVLLNGQGLLHCFSEEEVIIG